MAERSRNYIIKNVGRFNYIKMARGLDLASFSTEKRTSSFESMSGVSTQTYGDRWFLLPDGKGLFKTYDGNFGKNVRNIRMYNEMLCQELCKMVGIPCAEYRPAHFGDKDGLVSINFLKEGESLHSLQDIDVSFDDYHFNLVSIAQSLDKRDDLIFDKQKILCDLYKMIVFDILTLQGDRNTSNINFIYNREKSLLTVAPMFDSEFAYGCWWIEDIIEYDFLPNDVEYASLLNDSRRSITTGFLVRNNQDRSDEFFEVVRDVVSVARKYPYFGKQLREIMEKFDIQKAIDNLAAKGIVINEGYREFITKATEDIKKEIKIEMAWQKQNDNVEGNQKIEDIDLSL